MTDLHMTSLLKLFCLLLLAKSNLSLRQYSVSDKKCSEEQSEAFWTQLDQVHSSGVGDGCYLKVKEKVTSSVMLEKSDHLTKRDQLVEYQSKGPLQITDLHIMMLFLFIVLQSSYSVTVK